MKNTHLEHLEDNILNGGSFTAMPRFHATMTSQFMQLAKGK